MKQTGIQTASQSRSQSCESCSNELASSLPNGPSPYGVWTRYGTEFKEEESMMKATVLRTVIVLAAVSLAASSAMGAERMMLNEQFTATW